MSYDYQQLGDMMVAEADWPVIVWKALAVIASDLHPAYDAVTPELPGGSKEVCLFTSLCVRDFLFGIGYTDATVRPCAVVMQATRGDALVHSLGIGMPGEEPMPDKFNGHAVVCVPQLKLMIDATLYQAKRAQWGGLLSGMMALPYTEPRPNQVAFRTLKTFCGVALGESEDPSLVLSILWGERPDINWRRQLDATRGEQRMRRRRIAAILLDKYRRAVGDLAHLSP
jgi:hypothetical protein